MSKYSDITDFILSEIKCGNIKYNQKLPTIRKLSERFCCSKQTVVHAYDKLQLQHVVYSIPQSGYYLVDKTDMHKNEKGKLIDLSSGSPDESVLPYEEFQHCLRQAIEIYKASLFNYSPAQGLPGLIEILKTHFEEYQIFCSPEDIFIASGSQQAINILCSMPFPNGKKNVLVEQPTYKGVLKALEVTKTPVLGIERKFNGIDFNELERKFAQDNIKCFYTIPRFSNPLGVSYDLEDKKKILKLAAKYDVYIVEDDYLGDFELKSNVYPLYYTDMDSRVCYIKSFSKILLPGLRIAAVVLPKILRNTFDTYKRAMDLSTAVISQGALEIYLKSGMFNSNKKRIRKLYSERMKALKEVSESLSCPNIKWHIPATGFYGCIEFLDHFDLNYLIRECYKSDIIIKDLREDFLLDYFTNDILKISTGCANVKEIKHGVSKILEIISY